MPSLKRPHFLEERALQTQGFSLIAGTDEAGCGSWAGPVYAAAVILPRGSRIALIRDSKTLSAKQRESVIIKIKKSAIAWALGTASPQEIDALNIRRAGTLAMLRAIRSLPIKPHYVLSDAFRIPGLEIPCKNIVDGDAKVKSIAAASIIAKVERDRTMTELDRQYPEYGFAEHKGYGTKRHQAALAKHGSCPIHRLSYEPLQRYLGLSFTDNLD